MRQANIVQLKSQIYRTVIRPTALHGSECWPSTRNGEHKLSVMERRMLWWTVGITLLDHVCNDTVRERMKVAPIVKGRKNECGGTGMRIEEIRTTSQEWPCLWRSLEKDYGETDEVEGQNQS
ncbi:unnamed protein product [Strongylus vulgaris]|uniref:Uncharacterized protein n=1 Tax=Strongylus vulgaris TaxID=40348 RepID=A0A3P7I8U7_STRVU|nr:unnamed protein product [Strongylus vulgaris]